MKIPLETALINSAVLSISDKRYLYFTNIFKYYSLNPVPKRFNGFRNNDLEKLFIKNQKRDANAYNCSLGHAAIIKMAKYLDLPFIFIFEDDAYPCQNIASILQEYLNNISDNADIIILGRSHRKSTKQQPGYYSLNSERIYGSHAYIIFKKAYDKYLNFYHNNPKVAADMMLSDSGLFKNTLYLANNNLFIQYNFEKSNWGCFGYVYEKQNGELAQTLTPPKNFDNISNILNIQNIELQYIKPQLDKCLDIIIKKYKIDKIDNTKQCIIIGANPSLLQFKYGKKIDESNTFIIRLNRPPEQKYIENYGNRTDLFFGCTYLKNLLTSVNNKILIEHKDILDISKYFKFNKDEWFTTGMLAILLFSKIFKDIKIFGFGFSKQNEDTTFYHTVNNDNLKKTHHNLNYEHQLIDDMETNNLLQRLESITDF